MKTIYLLIRNEDAPTFKSVRIEDWSDFLMEKGDVLKSIGKPIATCYWLMDSRFKTLKTLPAAKFSKSGNVWRSKGEATLFEMGQQVDDSDYKRARGQLNQIFGMH